MKRDKYRCPICHKHCDRQRMIVEFIERSTKESGVPYYVEDREALEKVAVLMVRRPKN